MKERMSGYCFEKLPMDPAPMPELLVEEDECLMIIQGVGGSSVPLNEFGEHVIKQGALFTGGEGENGESTLVFLPNNVLYETSFRRGQLVVDTAAWWVEDGKLLLGDVLGGEPGLVLVPSSKTTEDNSPEKLKPARKERKKRDKK